MNAERQAVADIAIVWEQEGVAEREKEGRQASSHPQYRRISAPKEQPAEGDHMPRSAWPSYEGGPKGTYGCSGSGGIPEDCSCACWEGYDRYNRWRRFPREEKGTLYSLACGARHSLALYTVLQAQSERTFYSKGNLCLKTRNRPTPDTVDPLLMSLRRSWDVVEQGKIPTTRTLWK